MYFKILSSVLEDLHLCQYGAELQGSTASVPWNWFVGTKSPISVLFSPSSTADMHVSQLHSYNSSFLSYCHTVSCWHQLSVTLLLLEIKEISASLTLRTNFHLCLSYCHIPRTYWATQSPAFLDSSEENDWSKLFGPQSVSTLISCGAQSCPVRQIWWPFLETQQWDEWILAFWMTMLSKTYFSTEDDYHWSGHIKINFPYFTFQCKTEAKLISDNQSLYFFCLKSTIRSHLQEGIFVLLWSKHLPHPSVIML